MIERLRESKWFYILVSILLAVVFWLYVRAEEDPTTSMPFRNVPVQLTGTSVLASQGLTVAGLSDEIVDLEIEAPISVLENLNRYRRDLWVTLDVSRCVEGENQLSYTPSYPTNFNREGMVIQEQEPDTITVTVEKLATKTFPVEFQLDGKVAEGYQAGTPGISPETVVVSGPAEQVSRVDKVAAVLQREILDERFAGDLPLVMWDDQGKAIVDQEVTMDVDSAYVVLPVVVVKEIPLTVNFNLGGGVNSEEDYNYRIVPDTITVAGAEEDIGDLAEISLGSVDLAKVVGTNTFTRSIELDPTLENVSGITSANVTVTIQGLTTRTFEVDNIQLSNRPDGYTVTTVTQVREVTVRGREEDLEGVDASQIRIVVDMAEYTNEGTYFIPARVYLDASSTVGVIGDYAISVNISR